MSILSIGNAYNSRLKQTYFTNRKRLTEQLLNICKFDQANQQGAVNFLDLSCSLNKKSDPMPASTVVFFPQTNDFLAGLIA